MINAENNNLFAVKHNLASSTENYFLLLTLITSVFLALYFNLFSIFYFHQTKSKRYFNFYLFKLS